MTSERLQRWLESGALRRHRTSQREIDDLLAVAERDLADAQATVISLDRRFATAYSAALQLATIVLAAEGLRAAARTGHHVVTIQALPELMGSGVRELASYLDSCRALRNKSDYERVGVVTEADVSELLEEVAVFYSRVGEWLASTHPELA